MSERRKFIRFKLLLKGEFQLEVKKGTSSAKIIDFSREGLRLLITQVSFLSNTSVSLNVYLPDKHTPISIQGKIKWIRSVENYMEMGIKIENISPIGKSEILDHAYKRWREK